MTTKLPRPEIGGVVVKGLAKLGNRLRHVLRDKCVDESLFGEERLLPNDGSNSNRRVRASALGRLHLSAISRHDGLGHSI